MRIAVLGAGGIIAPAIVRDLAATPGLGALTLLDLDGDAARRVAAEHGGPAATGAAVDGTDRQALTLALEDHALLVNAASYRTNLAAMDAALAARVSYLDLGGLYHVTHHQLSLGPAFAAAGLVAILGCGAGPGKTNVMAVRGARELARVDEVRCASAGHDEAPPPGLAVPYALQTLLDELTEAPMVVREGAPMAIEPLTAGGLVEFPAPIGVRSTLFTLHSEVATLPGSLGAAAADFRLALAPQVEAALRDVVVSGARAADVATVPASPRTWSAQHVEVRGIARDATPCTVTVTAVTRPHDGWGLGGGIVSTGTVASATARLLARGALGGVTGVLPVEQVLTPELLFPELEARGTVFGIHIDSHDEVPTP